MTEGVSLDELRAVFLARDLHDGELGACGIGSALPLAAARLAQETHAPNLTLFLEGAVNPVPPFLIESVEDARAHELCEAELDIYDIYIAAESGLVDFWFMSAVQTDRHGDLNHFFVGGSPSQPHFRAPGIGNVSYASTATRWYNTPDSHSKRQFVESIEFRSAIGNGPARREQHSGYGGGCRYVVSPLAVLDFDDDGCLRLLHCMPGVSAGDVVSATDCELVIPSDVQEIPAVTPDELEILRRVVDPTGVLRRRP
jgi:glutaconate CoA-transferase subunit B